MATADKGEAENLKESRQSFIHLNRNTMKKYLLSMTAIALAVVLFAFTKPVKKATQVDMYFFEFDGTTQGGYSVDNVQDESNAHWEYIGKNLTLCGRTPEKASRVKVLGANVDNTTTPTELRNVIISASLNGGSKAIVTGITETGSQYGNQQD